MTMFFMLIGEVVVRNVKRFRRTKRLLYLRLMFFATSCTYHTDLCDGLTGFLQLADGFVCIRSRHDHDHADAAVETTIPESEDINRDNTLNEAESYFQYRIDLHPNMSVGTNNIINIQNSSVKLPNGKIEQEKWYQFKIPIHNYDHVIGGISDFRSIRFMRMFMSGWQDSVIMRFASLELGRNQWRTYNYSLLAPGENVPQQNQGLTEFSVTSVSIEENRTMREMLSVKNRQISSE